MGGLVPHQAPGAPPAPEPWEVRGVGRGGEEAAHSPSWRTQRSRSVREDESPCQTQGGVFKAHRRLYHRLVYHSTLGLRVIQKKKKRGGGGPFALLAHPAEQVGAG